MSVQDKYGVTFSSSEKIIITGTPQNLPSYIVPKSCKGIVGGSVKLSAFYSCRNTIKNITFEKESEFVALGEYIF